MWADLMTRWGAPIAKRLAVPSILPARFAAPVPPLRQGELCWPTIAELKKLERLSKEKMPPGALAALCSALGVEMGAGSLLVRPSGESESPRWAPSSEELQLRACIGPLNTFCNILLS